MTAEIKISYWKDRASFRSRQAPLDTKTQVVRGEGLEGEVFDFEGKLARVQVHDNTWDDFATLRLTEMFEGTRFLRFPQGVIRGLVGAPFLDETLSHVLASTSVTVYADYRYGGPEHVSIPLTIEEGAVEVYSIDHKSSGYGQSI